MCSYISAFCPHFMKMKTETLEISFSSETPGMRNQQKHYLCFHHHRKCANGSCECNICLTETRVVHNKSYIIAKKLVFLAICSRNISQNCIGKNHFFCIYRSFITGYFHVSHGTSCDARCTKTSHKHGLEIEITLLNLGVPDIRHFLELSREEKLNAKLHNAR